MKNYIPRFAAWACRVSPEEREQLLEDWMRWKNDEGWKITPSSPRGQVAGGLVQAYIESPMLMVFAPMAIVLMITIKFINFVAGA